MSTAAPGRQSRSGSYLDFDQYIEHQVEKARRGIRGTDLLTAGVGLAVLVLAYLCLFVILDHWVIPGGFSPAMRTVLLAAAGLLDR